MIPARQSLVLKLVVALVVLVLAAGPAAAQGFKEKLQNPFKGKGESESEASPAGAAPAAAPAAGMRHALLISQPKRKMEIEEKATLAFIDFKHIEDRVRESLPTYGATQTRTETHHGFGTQEIETRIRREGYNSSVCAAQVAAALAQHLSDLKEYQIVTRDHLGTVLGEQHLGHSGSVDSSTAAELGELIGADFLIYGQVQLCVSNQKDELPDLASLALGSGGDLAERKGGMLGGLAGALASTGAKSRQSEKLRSYVLAQIQMIEADTGMQVFTSSLRGEYETEKKVDDFDMQPRELVARAADVLADRFIDDFLARRESHWVPLYSDAELGFDHGIDLVQLGQCAAAARHFQSVYDRHQHRLSDRQIAALMHNHGIALMCSNEFERAQARLWASLRVADDPATALAAIQTTTDLVDRGREVLTEDDPIIRDVLAQVAPGLATASPAASAGTGSP